MEESNLINNDNTYNTDMSTSQSTIGGNATTNNKFNKDDLQEVTDGGGGDIVTPPTTKVDASETTQFTGDLTPILLILGATNYNAVINSHLEDGIPTIKLKGIEQSYCNTNYVIAVTETDKTIPVIYDSQNLSTTFTNNNDNWCRVTFKKPLDVTFDPDLGLNSDNFPDNSKIIVPVISCEENNTGQERNTTITFNIKNFAISHNIQMNVIQEKLENVVVPSKELIPAILYMDRSTGNPYTYKKYTNTESLHLYYYKNTGNYSTYLYIPDSYTTGYSLAWFGLLDSNGKADNNLEYTSPSTDYLSKYNEKFGCSISGLRIEISETNAYIKNTALTIVIYTTQTTEVNEVFKITYDGNFLCNVKKIEKDT